MGVEGSRLGDGMAQNHDGACFKELFVRITVLALDFLYHLWFPRWNFVAQAGLYVSHAEFAMVA